MKKEIIEMFFFIDDFCGAVTEDIHHHQISDKLHKKPPPLVN